MIQIDEQEYQRLKEIEARYLQIVRDSPPETDPEPPVLPEQECAALEEQSEPSLDDGASVTEELTEVTEELTLRPDSFAIVSETQYTSMDVWLILKRLTEAFRLSGASNEQPDDNEAMFAENVGFWYRFSANDYEANSKLKDEAKKTIWEFTDNCKKLGRVREARLERINGSPQTLTQELYAALRQSDCLLLLAIIHHLSTQPHLHLFWMERQGGGMSLRELTGIE